MVVPALAGLVGVLLLARDSRDPRPDRPTDELRAAPADRLDVSARTVPWREARVRRPGELGLEELPIVVEAVRGTGAATPAPPAEPTSTTATADTAVVAALWRAPGAREPDEAEGADRPRARMKQLFEDGQDAYADGDFALAHDLFMAANEVQPAASLVYNAAVSLEKLGDGPAAADLFEEYLLASPAPRDREAVEARIQTLRDGQPHR